MPLTPPLPPHDTIYSTLVWFVCSPPAFCALRLPHHTVLCSVTPAPTPAGLYTSLYLIGEHRTVVCHAARCILRLCIPHPTVCCITFFTPPRVIPLPRGCTRAGRQFLLCAGLRSYAGLDTSRILRTIAAWLTHTPTPRYPHTTYPHLCPAFSPARDHDPAPMVTGRHTRLHCGLPALLVAFPYFLFTDVRLLPPGLRTHTLRATPPPTLPHTRHTTPRYGCYRCACPGWCWFVIPRSGGTMLVPVPGRFANIPRHTHTLPSRLFPAGG